MSSCIPWKMNGVIIGLCIVNCSLDRRRAIRVRLSRAVQFLSWRHLPRARRIPLSTTPHRVSIRSTNPPGSPKRLPYPLKALKPEKLQEQIHRQDDSDDIQYFFNLSNLLILSNL